MHEGGLNMVWNVQPLCRVCHQFKDYNFPEDGYHLLQDESKVYGKLIEQFGRWLGGKKALIERRVELMLWFRDEYAAKLTPDQIENVTRHINQDPTVFDDHPEPLLSLGSLPSLQEMYAAIALENKEEAA